MCCWCHCCGSCQFEYHELATSCEDFSTLLVDKCRTTDEVELVLSQREGHTRWMKGDKYPRILLAIEYDIKRVGRSYLATSRYTEHTAHLIGQIRTIFCTYSFICFLARLFILLLVYLLVYLLDIYIYLC